MNDGQNVIKPVYVIPYECMGCNHCDIYIGRYFAMSGELDCFLFLSTDAIIGRHGDIIIDPEWFGRFLYNFTFNWV